MKLQKILIAICTCCVFYFLYQVFTTPPEPQILIQKELEKAVEIEDVPNISLNNERNVLIKNFKCEKIKIVSWYRGVPCKLKGEVFYEKEKKLRMSIKSVLSQEADIGSNDEIFWFWFKRMNPNALHFASHEDLEKARMKTPFHPMWIMRSLGLDQEEITDDVKIFQTDTSWILKRLMDDSNGRKVYKAALFDKETMRIKGYILQDAETKKTIAASVILSYITQCIQEKTVFLPEKMVYSWYEEDVTMLLDFENPEINTTMPHSNWVMPENNYIIDMGEEINDSKNVE